MSSKRLKMVAILTLSIVMLLAVAAPSMAKTKAIHSPIFGYDFKPASGWISTRATWYGPGYVWNQCANVKTLPPAGPKYLKKWRSKREAFAYLGAASLGNQFPLVYKYASHKGTWIQLKYRGIAVVIPIVDTGLYNSAVKFDLTTGTRSYLDWLAQKRSIKNYVKYSGCPGVSYRIVKKL